MLADFPPLDSSSDFTERIMLQHPRPFKPMSHGRLNGRK
jgi:hypothetical protein